MSTYTSALCSRTKAFVCPYNVVEVTLKALEWAEKEGYPEDTMLRLQD